MVRVFILDSSDDPQRKAKLIKFDINGNIIWERVYGPIREGAGLLRVFENSDGDLISVGTWRDESFNPEAIFLKTNFDGDSIWMRSYKHSEDPEGSNHINDIIEDDQGYYVACGMVQTSIFSFDPEKGQDAWVMRLDEYGCLVQGCHLVDIENIENADKKWFTFGPNPSSDFLNVYFAELLKTNPQAVFRVYSINGKLVDEISDISSSTTYLIPIYDLASGTYIIRLEDQNGIIQSEKFLKE